MVVGAVEATPVDAVSREKLDMKLQLSSMPAIGHVELTNVACFSKEVFFKSNSGFTLLDTIACSQFRDRKRF